MSMDSIVEDCPGCGRRVRVPTLRGPLRLTCPACRVRWDWSPPARLTQAEPDPARLAPFQDCMRAGAGSTGAGPRRRMAAEYPLDQVGRLRERRHRSRRGGRPPRRRSRGAGAVSPARRRGPFLAGRQGRLRPGVRGEPDVPCLLDRRERGRPAPIPDRRGAHPRAVRRDDLPARHGRHPALEEGAEWWVAMLRIANEVADVECMQDDGEDEAPYFEAFVSTGGAGAVVPRPTRVRRYGVRRDRRL